MSENINTSEVSKNPTNYNQHSDEEIDLKDLIARVWFKRKFIFKFIGVFILLGLFIAFTIPESFTASSTVVPQVSKKAGGTLGGLASMMGVNIASSSGETLSPYVYPQIINSVPFCKEIMETPIVVEKSNGKTITLYEYYVDNKYQPINILGGIKKYTIGLPFLALSALRSDKEPSTIVVTDSITGKLIILSKEEQEVIEIIRNKIKFDSNDQEGYVMIGYSFSEPYSTAVIAQNMYATLEKYVKNFKSEKQLDNLIFVEESYERARKDFMEKQATLAAFQDANRDLTSAMARTTERRLSSEYQVAYTVYNELAVQLEQAKIAVKESTPILTVIDPVVVPYKRSAPRRAFILFIFIFLGMLFSIAWVIVSPLLKGVINEVKNDKSDITGDEEENNLVISDN